MGRSRRAEDKECLNVPDLLGQANKRDSFEDKLAALLSNTTFSLSALGWGIYGLQRICGGGAYKSPRPVGRYGLPALDSVLLEPVARLDDVAFSALGEREQRILQMLYVTVWDKTTDKWTSDKVRGNLHAQLPVWADRLHRRAGGSGL